MSPPCRPALLTTVLRPLQATFRMFGISLPSVSLLPRPLTLNPDALSLTYMPSVFGIELATKNVKDDSNVSVLNSTAQLYPHASSVGPIALPSQRQLRPSARPPPRRPTPSFDDSSPRLLWTTRPPPCRPLRHSEVFRRRGTTPGLTHCRGSARHLTWSRPSRRKSRMRCPSKLGSDRLRNTRRC